MPINWNEIYQKHKERANNMWNDVEGFDPATEEQAMGNNPEAILNALLAKYEGQKGRINPYYRQNLMSLANMANTVRQVSALGEGESPLTYGGNSFSDYFRNQWKAQQSGEGTGGWSLGISPQSSQARMGNFLSRMQRASATRAADEGAFKEGDPDYTILGLSIPQLKEMQETMMRFKMGDWATSSAMRYLEPEYQKLITAGLGFDEGTYKNNWLNFLKELGYVWPGS